MTLFHVLFSTAEQNEELFEALLEKYPYYVLGLKDADDKLAMSYLVTNWTRENKKLVHVTLQSWTFNRLERCNSKSWTARMMPLVNAVRSEDDKGQRVALFVEACSIDVDKYPSFPASSGLEKLQLQGSGNVFLRM